MVYLDTPETARRQSRPLVAIVGSVDPQRNDYEPPIKNPDLARQACRSIGHELALAEYRLIVYSPSVAYIEADVVAGYVGSG